MIRGAQFFCLLVGATSEVRAPASVLFADGCLDSASECGTALLQSSMGRPRQAEAKMKTSTLTASESVKEALALWERMKLMIQSGELQEMRRALKKCKILRSELPSIQEERLGLLQESLSSFSFCDEELRRTEGHLERLERTAQRWAELHRTCTGQADLLKEEFAACQQNDTEHLQVDRCKAVEHKLHEKAAECASLHQVLKTTSCARASQMTSMCHSYQTCRRVASMASYRAHVAVHHARHGKAQWVVEALHCFEDRWHAMKDHQPSALQQEVQKCERRANDLLNYQDPPALPCNVTSLTDEGCAEILEPSLGPILEKDLTKEMAGGVSLMQQDIEKAEPAEPVAAHLSGLVEMQEALAGPLATPICLFVSFFTLSMLGVRCWMTGLRPGKDGGTAKSVDAWCVNRQEKLVDAEQPWLCGELMVPKKNFCTIFVPSLEQGSSLVTDKMGQSMFRTSRAELANGEIRLVLSRGDGAVLATACHSPGKTTKSWQIYQGSGDDLFASLEWEEVGKRSWFSKSTSGAFVIRTPQRQTLLRASTPSDSSAARVTVSLSDGFGRPVAVATQKPSGAMRIEVRSDSNTDLGLVTLAALGTVGHAAGSEEEAAQL